jgi:hypothetical protein
MKTIINMSIISFLILSNISAQKMEIEMGDLSKIEVYYIYGKISIIGTNDNKILLEVTKQKEVPINFNSLKFDLRESNSKMDLNIENNGSILKIYPSSIQAKISDYLIKIPKNLMVKINNEGGDKNKTWSPASFKSVLTDTILIQNMGNDIEIEASNYSILKIIDISGPIAAKSNFGDISIKFSSLSQARPSSIQSFSGQINLILPQTVNCDIVQSSFSGKFNSEIGLSNMEVKSPDPRVRSKTTVTNDEADTKISGKINNGGVKLYLRTFNSDINLRKTK